ncbi:MAG: adenylyltransferase/cytidyltransferase family protein [Candidatus Dojkabacteria bacterium]|jgi:D-beta-D-heptose 7-phosphate kinase/D-beta-D-heptose 1-phosphate adenosyltransferase|nr:adenylyltransferase/cytidyltransferase family protein [Candidatus Dojkabacteria bacterium]MDD4561198.1 adenylyltransferase/cytidyltransferase family protein [Candidatus Dojkabacteria bacterium]NLB12044.1 adenylyltransferase/cytidyltransferase family protein [Candidatus Dojkabacteria bacterium]
MVISADDFKQLKETEFKGKTIVATSGYFDPIHPGHVSCIMDSKKFGDILVVIVDGDSRCINKKGKAFIPAKDRADIVDAIKGVDYVIIHENPNATNCSEVLEIIRPDIFTKGGDRDDKNRHDPNSPLKIEADLIESYGGKIEYGVGRDKVWSSSNYLEEWYQFRKSEEEKES